MGRLLWPLATFSFILRGDCPSLVQEHLAPNREAVVGPAPETPKHSAFDKLFHNILS